MYQDVHYCIIYNRKKKEKKGSKLTKKAYYARVHY